MYGLLQAPGVGSEGPMVFSLTAADVDRLKRLQFGAAPNYADVRKPLRRQNYTTDSDVDVADCSDEEEQSGSQGPPGFPVPVYTVNALSTNGLKMMFDGCIAAQSRTPLRILVDTGANRNFVSQRFIDKYGIKMKKKNVWLKLADGNTAISQGVCNLPLTCNRYQATLPMMALRMNSDFDVILGSDWCQQNKADIMFSIDHLHIGCAATDGSEHWWHVSKQGAEHSVECSIIAAADLNKVLSCDDKLFMLTVNAVAESAQYGDISISADIERDVKGKWADVFKDLPAELPPERGVFHTIPLKENESAPDKKMYRMTRDEMQECEKQVKMLLEKGFIQRSNSEYGSPVIFVAKKDGSMQMCIDYRALNKQTRKNRYPIPRIDDMFDKLQGATVFSSIDLQSAYHQVRLKPEDIPKTAFTTPFGLFEYTVLCFGLTNAPATFQSVMNDALQDMLGNFVLVYMDDIDVFSKTPEEHMVHLNEVMRVFTEHMFYAKLSKFMFAQSELLFLGHVVGKNGVRVDPKKVTVVKDWTSRSQYLLDLMANNKAATADATVAGVVAGGAVAGPFGMAADPTIDLKHCWP